MDTFEDSPRETAVVEAQQPDRRPGGILCLDQSLDFSSVEPELHQNSFQA